MVPAATSDICDRMAASASADGTHSSAVAVERAVAELGREPELVLIFPAGALDPDAVLVEAHEAAQGARVAGMTGTASIGADGLIQSGCSAIAFSSSLSAGVGAADARDPRTAGRDAAVKALAEVDEASHHVVFLFVDSECGDQAEVVAGAYSVAGGTVPLAGGAAGGPACAQFGEGRALSHGVVAVAIGGSTPIGVGIAHGCVPRGAPSIVTRSVGTNVLQLDGRPAQDVYFEKLGVDGMDVEDEEFDVLAMVHPIAQPDLRGDVRPRYVRGRGPDGGLVCATSIERNAPVQICDQTPDTIVESARAAVEDAVSQLHGPAEAAVVFDCAGRSAWFGGALAARELEALVATFGDPMPSVAGVFTRGEIGRIRGAKGDRNHSVVVAAFSGSD
jgi:hypothetical protein